MMSPRKSAGYYFFIAICYMLLTSLPAAAATTQLEAPFAEAGKAVIVFDDNPLKSMTETPFAIMLFDAEGQPISDANLKLDLTMPAMPMPPNHPPANWRDGAYHGTAIFTMAGAWDINVAVERQGSATETVVFKIEMVIMK